jgi:hypothetical protein
MAEYEINNANLLNGWNELSNTIHNQKLSLSVGKKEELRKWFLKRESELQSILNMTSELDKQINNEVYHLYDLSNEEIELVNNFI